MALMVTTIVFGQVNRPYYPLEQPVNNTNDRTGWIGNTESRYYTTLDEGEKFGMRLPASGALPTGPATITKVSFGWQQTAGGETMSGDFKVQIYTGGNGDWISNSTATQTINRTYDLTVQGTLAYEQAYQATDNGWQIVELEQPVSIPANQEVWVVIECLGNTCTWIAVDEDEQHPEWWGMCVNEYLRQPQNPTTEDPGGLVWWTPSYYNSDQTTFVTCRYALKVLVDDGQEYQPVTDWRVDMYSIETADDQEEVEYIYIDQYALTDSLYVAPALWNMGIDSNYSDGTFRLYIENSDVVFMEYLLTEITSDINVASGRGWIFDNIGGLMAFDEMAELGLTFPFTVCASYETQGNDPDLTNNVACVLITDVDPEGIAENNNTLNVFPNPASTTITVANAAGAQIYVYNIAGQEVMAIEAANANETINVSNLTEGVYVVRVVNGNEVATSKVSIVR